MKKLVIATAFLSVCSVTENVSAAMAFNTILDRLFTITVEQSPELKSTIGLFEVQGIREHNARLDDRSLAAALKHIHEKKEILRALEALAPDILTPEQLVSYETCLWTLRHDIAGEQFLLHQYPVTQIDGIVWSQIFLLTEIHRLQDAVDVEHYIARLDAIAHQVYQVIDYLKKQQQAGIYPPRFVVEKVVQNMARVLPEDPTQHVLYTHLVTNMPASITPESARVYQEQAQKIIAEKVYPAYQALCEYHEMLLPHVSNNHGVWALPQGEGYYQYMLEQHTTTNLTAEEIHALGHAEVARIRGEIDTILAQLGTTLEAIKQDSKFYYPNTDEGRAQCIADYLAMLERSRTHLGPLFDLKPEAGVTIHRVPEREQAGAPGAYYMPGSLDRTRPGKFFANLRDMAEVPTYHMETLLIHEAEPGHHFQCSLQNELDLPLIRKIAGHNAYIEGWALYTERLAGEYGFYSSPYMQIGNLLDELMRAVRLVVDTGIHHKRWSHTQAVEYMEHMTGMHHDSVVTEIERYFVWPGQACSYKIGQLKILALRERAKKVLGDRFSLQQFHNVVLGTAAVPLAVLESVVDHWIESLQGAETV